MADRTRVIDDLEAPVLQAVADSLDSQAKLLERSARALRFEANVLRASVERLQRVAACKDRQ